MRDPSRSARVPLVAAARSEGTSPKSTPVITVTPSANSNTRPSSGTSSTRQPSGGCIAINARTPARPSATPVAPPAIASARLSVIIWRTIRPRPAPRAERTATSRVRPDARTSSRLATFAHANSSSVIVDPRRICNGTRASPARRSWSGMMVARTARFVSGASCFSLALTASNWARASSSDTPSLSRATTCTKCSVRNQFFCRADRSHRKVSQRSIPRSGNSRPAGTMPTTSQRCSSIAIRIQSPPGRGRSGATTARRSASPRRGVTPRLFVAERPAGWAGTPMTSKKLPLTTASGTIWPRHRSACGPCRRRAAPRNAGMSLRQAKKVAGELLSPNGPARRCLRRRTRAGPDRPTAAGARAPR